MEKHCSNYSSFINRGFFNAARSVRNDGLEKQKQFLDGVRSEKYLFDKKQLANIISGIQRLFAK